MATETNDNGGRVFARIPKGVRGEEIVVSIGQWQGRSRVDMRLWYPKDGAMAASRAGVAIEPDALSEIIRALVEAGEYLASGGLQ